jgi:major membrane immunogen (membrane-anchored lipoprotein)
MRYSKPVILKGSSTALAIALASALTGCGMNAQPSSGVSSKGRFRSSSGILSSSGNISSGSSDVIGGSPTQTGGNDGTYNPSISTTIRGTGYNGMATVTVRAGKTLKVQFSPNAQDTKVAGTGFMPAYNKLGVWVSIQVGNPSANAPIQGEVATNLLSMGQASAVIDFSSFLPASCRNSTDPTCRRTITVRFTRANYDYDCINFGWGCPSSQVRPTHPWNGNVLIETDDTAPLVAASNS